MSDFLMNLARRVTGEAVVLQPLVPSLFESGSFGGAAEREAEDEVPVAAGSPVARVDAVTAERVFIDRRLETREAPDTRPGDVAQADTVHTTVVRPVHSEIRTETKVVVPGAAPPLGLVPVHARAVVAGAQPGSRRGERILAAAPAQETVISVNIGRVDVRSSMPSAPAVVPRRSSASSALPLADYLRQRNSR